jgi:monoamine oxidase
MGAVHDVLVLGAGVAGLAAAAELVRAGRDVLVVESRHRVGGRVMTVHDERTDVPLELGAELVHDGAEAVREVAREAGLSLLEVEGSSWMASPAGPRPADGFDERIGRTLARAASSAGSRDTSFADALAGAHVTGEDERQALAFVQGFHAADPRIVGVRALTRGGAGGPGRSFRVHRGYDAIARALEGRVGRASIWLGSTVEQVGWRRGVVRVSVASGSCSRRITARSAIVALPLGVLSAGMVRFDPPLESTQRALARLEVGHVAKLVLRFREAFWTRMQGGERARAAFFFDPLAAFPTFWTARPFDAPVVIAWSGGPPAMALLALDRAQMVEAALDAFAAALGIARRVPHDALEAAFLHDWSSDPHALGAYSYPRVGGADAGPRSSAPLEDTLYFAGEHTAAPPDHGTVHGAIESGVRAARALLDGHRIRRPPHLGRPASAATSPCVKAATSDMPPMRLPSNVGSRKSVT